MALGFQPGIDIQRARADQHHARPLLRAREQMAAARLAERTELAGRGVEGHEIVRAGHDLEAAFLYGQDRGKRGAGEFPAIRTMAIREDQDLAGAFIANFSAIATARQHGGLLRFGESVPQTDRNAKGEKVPGFVVAGPAGAGAVSPVAGLAEASYRKPESISTTDGHGSTRMGRR